MRSEAQTSGDVRAFNHDYEAKADYQQVLDFYKRRLPELGWPFEHSEEDDGFELISFRNEDGVVIIDFSPRLPTGGPECSEGTPEGCPPMLPSPGEPTFFRVRVVAG